MRCWFCSVRVAPAAASAGHPGSAGLPDHPPLPAQEEEAERQSDQPEDPEGEPKGDQRDRHRGPEQHQSMLLPLLALQNRKSDTFHTHYLLAVTKQMATCIRQVLIYRNTCDVTFHKEELKVSASCLGANVPGCSLL